MINIGIIEDNYFLLNSYKEFLGDFKDIQISFALQSMEEFEHMKPEQTELHLVLMDIVLPGKSGLEGIDLVLSKYPGVKILLLTGMADQHSVIEAIKKGANGYLIKPDRMQEVYTAIKSLISDGAYISPKAANFLFAFVSKSPEQQFKHLLTPRELEIVQLLKDGLSYKELGEKLFLSVFTVNHHLKKIYKKMGVTSKAQLMAKVFGN